MTLLLYIFWHVWFSILATLCFPLCFPSLTILSFSILATLHPCHSPWLSDIQAHTLRLQSRGGSGGEREGERERERVCAILAVTIVVSVHCLSLVTTSGLPLSPSQESIHSFRRHRSDVQFHIACHSAGRRSHRTGAVAAPEILEQPLL